MLRTRRLPDDGFDQAVPLAAVTALAFPAQEGLAALLADVPALGPRRAARGPRHSALVGLDGGLRLDGVDVEAGLGVPVDHDRRAGLVFAEQEMLGEDVFDHVLDHAAERPG